MADTTKWGKGISCIIVRIERANRFGPMHEQLMKFTVEHLKIPFQLISEVKCGIFSCITFYVRFGTSWQLLYSQMKRKI